MLVIMIEVSELTLKRRSSCLAKEAFLLAGIWDVLDKVLDQAIISTRCKLEDLVLLSELRILRCRKKSRLLAEFERRVVDRALWRVPNKGVCMPCELVAPEVRSDGRVWVWRR